MLLGDFSPVILIALACLLGIASYTDSLRQKIPNWLNGSAIVAGLIINTFISGFSGTVFSLLGILTGFLCFIPGYLLSKKLGAGDVKLMAAVGAFLGWKSTLMAAGLSIVAGGVLAIIYMGIKGDLLSSLKRYWLSVYLRTYLAPEKTDTAGQRFPYAIAITTGVLAQFWYRTLFV